MERSIKRDFQALAILTIIVSMTFLSGFWVFYDYQNLQQESARLRQKHMSEYEDTLRYQVDRVVADIKYEQSLMEQRLKESIQERTHEACDIAKSIIRRNEGKLEDAALKIMAKDSLRDIRFNKGRGYYFAVNMNGTVELFPTQPELEGQDLRGHSNRDGQFVVADMLKIASAGEGFYRYSWSKPNELNEFPKIAFVKYIPELDWIVGTGEYLDDFTAVIQEQLCRRIEQVRFGKDKNDYVFVATYDGIGTTFPAKGKNMLETRDANGVYIVKELIKKAQGGGGFVQYIMPMLGNVPSKPKLSYAAPIPEWRWYVGSGVYIDEIDRTIAENQQVFKDKIVSHLEIMLLVLLSLLVLHFIVSYFISRNIWRQMDLFAKFFRKASKESVFMESTVLAYKEFREISYLSNNMLKERNTILEEIRLSRDEWVGTFDAIGDCIILVDGKGDIIRANKTAARLHGLSVQSLISKPFAELCCHDNPVNMSLIDKLPHTAEITNDEMKRIFLASSFPILSPDGRLERIIHIAHDITEQKKLEQQLVQSQKMEALGTLAGGIAHDFNNILTAILGFTDLARRASPTESRVVGYLDQVMQASTRAKDLIKQILSFSRQAKTEKIPLQPTPIVQETLKLLRSTMPSTITIKENINIDSASCILADPTQIHQIIMNICTNACQAMEENGGILSVSVQETYLDKQVLGNQPDVAPGEFIKFSFSDNGPGIPIEIQEKIFDPFFTTKETGKGTGMGLAIAHGIVKSYGGVITCNSRLGEGTVFDIFLPTLKKDTKTTADSPEMSQGGSERILFVDDEKMLVDMSRIVLEQLGYTVTTFTSSLDALAAFKQNPTAFDLIITDHNMPGMTGADLAKQILRIQPNLPIILCTGYSSTVSKETATSVGIKEFLMKPLIPQEIAIAIRKALGKMEPPLCN